MNEFQIASYVSRFVFGRRCLLLVDRCTWTGHEADILAVTNDLRLIDVEVKISRSDFKADAKKDKWWMRRYGAYNPAGLTAEAKQPRVDTARLHPPRVWKHYFAMPEEVWSDDLTEFLPSAASGVILVKTDVKGRQPAGRPAYPDAPRGHKVIRRAKPDRNAYRLSAEQAVDIARLAGLRMWDAYDRAIGRETQP